MEDPAAQPNEGAANLLRDSAFQRHALVDGAECAETADALQTAAGPGRGGILSISQAEGALKVRHPTSLGDADSDHHQVFTDGDFVFDPIYSPTAVPRGIYETMIRQLNGPTVDISFFSAQLEEDPP
jgi:hypothetical protein